MAAGALLCTIIFLLLYIPIYMLLLYIISYAFDVPYRSQGLIQTLVILLFIIFFVPVGMNSMSEVDKHRHIADLLHQIFAFINPFYSSGGFFLYLLKVCSSCLYTTLNIITHVCLLRSFFDCLKIK